MNNLLLFLSRKIDYPLIPPAVLQISLTYRCNLKCKMCTIGNLAPASEELSTDQLTHIINQARDYGVEEVLLTGGEPFLRQDIFQICKYASGNNLRIIVTTNGALIDEQMAGNIVDSGIGHIHFSLDGTEEINDSIRGKGAFQKTMEGLRILQQKRKQGSHFSIGIAVTVMDNNVKELLEIVKLADNLGVDVINFQPVLRDNANFMNKELPDSWVKEENIEVLINQLKEVSAYPLKHLKIHNEPNPELLVKYYLGTIRSSDWKCFGGFKTAFICFDKNRPLVYSCHGTCGNLDEISLEKAWKSMEAKKLRYHSRSCTQLCLQSCYSLQSAESLRKLVNSYIRRAH